jgi:hypothetical protein
MAVAIFLMSALWIGAKGAITMEVAKLFALGLPALLVGPWLGLSCSSGSTGRRSARSATGFSKWGC